MESKYNLLTGLLKNIKNVITPDGGVAGSGGGVMIVHEVTNTLLNGVLPNIDGYEFTQGLLSESTASRFSFPLDIGELSLSDIVVLIDGEKVLSHHLNYENGKLEISMSPTANESVITGLTITVTSKGWLDHTYAEIKAAPLSVIHASEGDEAIVSFAKRFYHDNGLFFILVDPNAEFACETEADYPYRYSLTEGNEGPIH